ncbi:MAG TPA: endonuclease domain-containing protein [Bacteroidota bacterium]|nr:endonuclease domain-containing protein [Bacteroidota bacterium]
MPPSKELRQLATQLARDLRKRETPAEKILWNTLRNRQFLGERFLRQHPLYLTWLGKDWFVIVDFYIPKYRLVIEVDGGIHEAQKEYDLFRTILIETRKIHVARFKNSEIVGNLDSALQRIRDSLSRNSSPRPPSLKS